MGVDLHRIGFGISSGTSRTGFGTIVSFPSGPSCPAAGSFNSNTALIEYSIANGGDFFSITLFGGTSSTDVPNENAQFQIKNDGSCGTYTDYATAFNVGYKSNGVIFDTDLSASTGYSTVELPNAGSGTYYTIGDNYSTRVHDGSGSWTTSSMTVYLPYNSVIATFNNQTAVPSSSGIYYDNGTAVQYESDGIGGYYTANVGSLFPAGTDTGLTGLDVAEQTEVPSGGGLYGTGRTIGYTWNGSGGYNYPVTKGNYHNNGVFITFIPDNTFSTSTEVPSGSSTYYDAKQCGNDYFWDGSGGYSVTGVCKYYTNGTYIYNDGTYDYYWDGTGGYYSV